ncbi:unnamed protein product [Heterobilharzia americana]|nr:unnamed protein product [Heterobilharzia americana]
MKILQYLRFDHLDCCSNCSPRMNCMNEAFSTVEITRRLVVKWYMTEPNILFAIRCHFSNVGWWRWVGSCVRWHSSTRYFRIYSTGENVRIIDVDIAIKREIMFGCT